MTLGRTVRAGLAALAVVATGIAIAPAPAGASSFSRIYNVHSQQCLTYQRSSGLFVQEPCSSDQWQQFVIYSASTGGYLLDDHGICMDAPSIGNGVQVVGVFCNLTNSQVGSGWTFNSDRTIRVNISGWVACLDLSNGSTVNGQPMQIWSCNPNTDNQHWVLASF